MTFKALKTVAIVSEADIHEKMVPYKRARMLHLLR